MGRGVMEYLPWYEAGTQLCRCLGCGTLLSTGDTELHDKWHATIGA